MAQDLRKNSGNSVSRQPPRDVVNAEPVGNNLSFPVIWSENGNTLSSFVAVDEFKFTTPYNLYDEDEVIDEKDQINGFYQFAQKTPGNVWQAESAEAFSTVYVTQIDWGDSLESIDMKSGRPVRVELSLYKNLGITHPGEAVLPSQMLSFPMELLANPSSPDEQKGVGATGIIDSIAREELPYSEDGKEVNIVMSNEASIYATGAHLIIQPLIGTREEVSDGDLQWTGSQWEDGDSDDPTDIGAPIPNIVFGGELNVSGKVIYGLSQGGWTPRDTGDYRITFYLEPTVNTQIEEGITSIKVAEEEVVAAIAAEEGSDIGGGDPVICSGIDPVSGVDRNLTYIDISVVSGGGGGSGGNGGNGNGGPPSTRSNDLISLGVTEFSSFSQDPLQSQFQQLDCVCDPALNLVAACLNQ